MTKLSGSWKINEDFTIHQDSRYWAVDWRKDGVDKDGKAIKATYRYYPSTLFQACKSIIDHTAHDGLDENNLEDCEMIMNKIEQVNKDLSEMIKNIKLWRHTDINGRW